ncbi:MAG TPA: heavy metal-binding domain-containing protein [Weissella thailandensis]|uniref:heavy metal-binding domain-containing protein n=1 Tax=Weissella thailandensis TaxID=89061 RepID=UPI001E156D2E|nr:heavy metal-binding domain-containing protein [Weissella thailandensis]HJA24417.1 heavy metal-binding domain-containing protein [Candidatus Limosilactobacillus intestinavium]HJG84834.1 heavy metal-binding domain-containing protein [Weissella thailandensis]
MSEKVLVTTTEAIAGYHVVETMGEVFGLTTRSRNVVSSFGQSMKAIVGGEIKGYTKLQDAARNDAIDRLKTAAAELDANAVIMMRFDSSSGAIGDSVTAYGTAVKIEKDID